MKELAFKLEEEVKRLLEELGTLKPESDEYKAVLNNLTQLYKSLNDEKKVDLDVKKIVNDEVKEDSKIDLEQDKLKLETEKLELEKIKEENLRIFKSNEIETRNRELSDTVINNRNSNIKDGVKIAVEVVAVVAPLLLYSAFMNKGFEFEKEGTFTSQTFKGLFGKIGKTK